jgi:hypothetical protein
MQVSGVRGLLIDLKKPEVKNLWKNLKSKILRHTSFKWCLKTEDDKLTRLAERGMELRDGGLRAVNGWKDTFRS